MYTLQEEALFEDLESKIEVINESVYLWTRYDTIWCLESTKEKKDGIVHKVFNTIKSIIEEAKKLIKKALSSIGNHIRYGLLSSKNKEKYNEFCEWVAKNPKVKQQKVSVKDWQRIMKEYDIVEKNIVKYMNDDTVDSRGLNMKANELLKDLSSVTNSATAAISVDLCMVLARKSPEMAKTVQVALENCNSVLENIDAQLGEGQSEKLKKNIEKLTKESVGQRILAQLFQKKEKSIMECITEVTTSFEKLMSGEATVVDKAKAAVEHRNLASSGARAYVKNKRTREGVKSIKNIVSNVKNSDGGKALSEIKSVAQQFTNPTV